ncbi:hypothetical protein BH11BAC3_BH11BAC3_23740 [soil metagenome]
MNRRILAALMLIFSITEAKAQLGVMKLIGNGTKDYKLGFGAFIKTGFPFNEGSDITIEGGANIFFLDDGYGTADGTIMCPLKVGYRYTLNKTGEGFYVEPQVGYNLYGITSLNDENGYPINLKYHGVVFAAGTGYLFTLWNQPFDLNFRYETVIAHGGSNNFISLGISRFISFKKRDADY